MGFGNSVINRGPNILEENASFFFHQLENVCSCGKFFGIYLEATSCESKKNRIELRVPHSGNQPSLTEKFDTVYGIVEQSEHF